MDHRAILRRIRAAVRRGTYLVPTTGAPPAQRAALEEVARGIAAGADPDDLRRRIGELETDGRIDRVMALSALGVLAASPLVGDYAEAARLAGQQELAALDLGGPWRDAYLASADRHRGVVAFLNGHDVAALDWFTRAFARERSAENAGNVLAALLRLGAAAEASDLAATLLGILPPPVRAALRARIDEDDDLGPLRDPAGR